MVKICSDNYPKTSEEKYKMYYEKYPYQLHDFQKWSIEAIVTGNHVLVTAPTGTGKTFSGEFALDFFYSIGKKTIYTTPIKALSNEKFYAFTQKYPNIRVGLITGDIKTNPDADVLIMTTEILLNKLYQNKSNYQVPTSSISFEMDIEKELGCVVFDEIHFINNEERGHTWEQSIMMLPPNVQMIGLSATLDNPERFAHWLETKGKVTNESGKEVYLAKKLVRTVPLIHYNFTTVTNGINKVIKDKATQEEIRNATNKLFVIQDEKGVFKENQYKSTVKMLDLFEKNNVRVKRQHVLNKVTEHLVEKEMLPALCYVFSRKQLEKCAEELTTNLLEFDSKVPYIVDRECEQIIRKLPNYEEYLCLPEYIKTVKLLRKGVGIHHAGLLPILREIIEMLFARGFIKILFCTETMSIGINLPVKTTIFTDINKHDGTQFRILHGHEYTQSAGRAGRLGLDNVGHVIHLNNLFRNVNSVNYRQMLKGSPQTLTSKFKISYNLLLNLLHIGDNNPTQFAARSMVTDDINNEIKIIESSINQLNNDINKLYESLEYSKTPVEIIEEYLGLTEQKKTAINKKRKEIERKIENIHENFKSIESDKLTFIKYKQACHDFQGNGKYYEKLLHFTEERVNVILELLDLEGFIEKDNSKTRLTNRGILASQLREVHCLVFANITSNNFFDDLSAKQIVSIFSCFTNINVNEELKAIVPYSEDKLLLNKVTQIQNMLKYYNNKEIEAQTSTGIDYNIHFDLIDYIVQWCDCECVEDCKLFLQKLEKEKDIFLGEFAKALLKINNISCEMEKIAEIIGNIPLLSKLKEIPMLTLKYVVTTQSLYV